MASTYAYVKLGEAVMVNGQKGTVIGVVTNKYVLVEIKGRQHEVPAEKCIPLIGVTK